ncbi:hypothetical protein KSP39_PZI013953 [Platanthera zijinensis]|uniref:Uncharacterized protein n=1 Tax=Platanthera zijinensis TaxID=2320716 RepID=A0AAP0BDE4_9ASPA
MVPNSFFLRRRAEVVGGNLNLSFQRLTGTVGRRHLELHQVGKTAGRTAASGITPGREGETGRRLLESHKDGKNSSKSHRRTEAASHTPSGEGGG